MSQEAGVSKVFVFTVMNVLKCYPCRILVVFHLQPADPVLRSNFFNYLFRNIHNDVVSMMDEAWFHLIGYMNSQNMCH